MAGKNLDKKAQVRLIVGIAIIMFGSIASLFIGLGIILSNSDAIWVGGLLLGVASPIIAIITRFIR